MRRKFTARRSRLRTGSGLVGAVLAVQTADARAEPHADHREGREVDLGVAVGVGDDGGERGALILLDEASIADVLEPPVGDVGRGSRGDRVRQG